MMMLLATPWCRSLLLNRHPLHNFFHCRPMGELEELERSIRKRRFCLDFARLDFQVLIEPPIAVEEIVSHDQMEEARMDDAVAPQDLGMDIDLVESKPETDLKELFAVLCRDEKEAIREAEQDILAIVRSLGGDRGKYKRERMKAVRAVVSEIYSPPRVTAATKLLPELKVIPGFALDLTTVDEDGRRWDFDDVSMQERALKRVREERPMLLVGSPMCTAFSTWQRINNKIRDKYVVECEKRRAVMHLEFCIKLYREQLRNNRYFLHEHPAHASSWQEDAMRGLMGEQGVKLRCATSACMVAKLLMDRRLRNPRSFSPMPQN